jgi:hypothetical protein
MKELKYGHEFHQRSKVESCCVHWSASNESCSTLDSICFAKYIVACRPVDRQVDSWFVSD